MKQYILFPMLGAVVIGATILGANKSFAQSNGVTLAQMIAQKFNLDQAQVQTVVDEYRQKEKTDMRVRKQQMLEDRLKLLVTDGKITEAQKQAILAKMTEIKNMFDQESLKDISPEERKQKIETLHNELKSWAESQGIDANLLMPFKVKMHKGIGGEWMKDSTTTPTPQS